MTDHTEELIIQTAPEKIYLITGDDCPRDVDFSELSEVTWCADDAGGGIEYIRAALATQRIAALEAENERLRATPAQEVRQEAVAWRHTLHMELDQKVVVVSESVHQPFGVRGENFDDAYSVTIEPLYTTPQPGPDVRALVEALEWYEQQAAGCRKLTSEGDDCRQALDSDGGKRAQTALAAHRQAQRQA